MTGKGGGSMNNGGFSFDEAWDQVQRMRLGIPEPGTRKAQKELSPGAQRLYDLIMENVKERRGADDSRLGDRYDWGPFGRTG